MAYQRHILFGAEKRGPFLLFFGASTLAFAALAASYYGDSDYNPRIISILPQSDQDRKRISQKLFAIIIIII